jgi:beta-aspartyl-dipeptidase (metallo-type)
VYWESGAPLDRVTVSSDGGGCLPVFDADGRVVSMEVGDCSALMATVDKLTATGHSLESVLRAFTCNVASLLRFADTGKIETGHRFRRDSLIR